MTSFSTQTCLPCIMSMNIEHNLSPLTHLDVWKLSTSVSPLALLLPENFRRRQKKKWDQLQLNTLTEIYFSYVIFHFCLMGTNGYEAHIPYSIDLHNPTFPSNRMASFWSNIYCVALKMSEIHGFFCRSSFFLFDLINGQESLFEKVLE